MLLKSIHVLQKTLLQSQYVWRPAGLYPESKYAKQKYTKIMCIYIYIHGRQTKVAKEDELEEEEPPEQDERQHQTTQLKRATHKNIWQGTLFCDNPKS